MNSEKEDKWIKLRGRLEMVRFGMKLDIVLPDEVEKAFKLIDRFMYNTIKALKEDGNSSGIEDDEFGEIP